MQGRNEMRVVHLRARHILLAVANHYDVGIEQLRGDSRRRRIVWPRFVACWLMHEMLGYSTIKIGRALGDWNGRLSLRMRDRGPIRRLRPLE